MRALLAPHPEEREHPSRPSVSEVVANGANNARVSKDEGPAGGLALRDARQWRAPQSEDRPSHFFAA